MTDMTLPTYAEFASRLRQQIRGRKDMEMVVAGVLAYQTQTEKRNYDFYKIFSKGIGSADPILLIRAAIHGDETAGALTLMEHLGELCDYAHARGVKLVIFPLDNPSGFEKRTRYNMEGDSGDGGNNDFIRYELTDGSIVDDIGTSKEFKTWAWSSDPSLGVHLAKETALLHAEVKKLPLSQVRGILDIHQDNYIVYPGAYWYAFGDTARYDSIVSSAESITHVFKNEHIDSGFLNGPSYSADQAGLGGKIVPDAFDPVTDDRGFIMRHDCTLPDLFFHLGADHCITVETTTVSGFESCDRVNLIWAYGLIDMISKKEQPMRVSPNQAPG